MDISCTLNIESQFNELLANFNYVPKDLFLLNNKIIYFSLNFILNG